MKYLCYPIALFCLSAFAGQFFEVESGSQPGHLTPVDYPADEYDERIARHLFLTGGELARFVRLPSFGPESCSSVYSEATKEAIKKYGRKWAVPADELKYFVTLTRASESLYHSMAENNDDKKTRKVKIDRIDREVSLALAVAVQRAWGRMLQHTKYPARASNGLDGDTYRFSVFVKGLGDLYGETWSPSRGLPAEMVSLGESLAEFASNRDAKEEPLINRLKEFEAKIPKA